MSSFSFSNDSSLCCLSCYFFQLDLSIQTCLWTQLYKVQLIVFGDAQTPSMEAGWGGVHQVLNLDPFQSNISGVSWVPQLLIQVNVGLQRVFSSSRLKGKLEIFLYTVTLIKEIQVTYQMFIQQGLFFILNSLYLYAFIFLIMRFSVLYVEALRICQNPWPCALQHHIFNSCVSSLPPPFLSCFTRFRSPTIYFCFPFSE